jgi:hypothetical protein
MAHFDQTINTIAPSITITAEDFPGLWAEAMTMANFLKNRLLNKHGPSVTTPIDRYHGKKPPI